MGGGATCVAPVERHTQRSLDGRAVSTLQRVLAGAREPQWNRLAGEGREKVVMGRVCPSGSR